MYIFYATAYCHQSIIYRITLLPADRVISALAQFHSCPNLIDTSSYRLLPECAERQGTHQDMYRLRRAAALREETHRVPPAPCVIALHARDLVLVLDVDVEVSPRRPVFDVDFACVDSAPTTSTFPPAARITGPATTAPYFQGAQRPVCTCAGS